LSQIVPGLLRAAVLTAALVSAPRGGKGGRRDRNEMPVQTRLQRVQPIGALGERLKLNEDQRQEFESMVSAAREKAASVSGQIRKQRVTLADAIIENQADRIDFATNSYAEQMAGIEAKAFPKVCALLKSNQQSTAASAFKLMAAAVERPGMSQPAPGPGTEESQAMLARL
jgi:hypothetical protein